ncbi:Conserved oligomeric Golgi complex subunit 2, partial [Lunasporangiospora selenospora]
MGENLSNVLRTCVHSIQSGEAQSPSNKEALTQCLRTYALIDQTGEAEKIISEDLLAPFINKTITQPTLSEQTHTQRNGTNGVPQRHLVIMYNHIITFIEANCRALINVTQKELKGTNYDIPVNCIWDVTTQAILKHSKTILPLVNADGFHRNFMDTMDFVSKIEELCGSRRSLIRLRAHPNYQAIMKGWQLPAYFQLRFREISTVVEDALQLSVDNLPKIPGVDEHLPSSTAVIRAVERCWSSDVYVYGIAYSFWKLTLQILARYTVWVSANVARVTDSAKERPALSRSSSPAPGSSGSINSRQTGRSTPAPASLRPTGPVGRNTLEDQMLQQLTLIAGDIDHVAQKIQEAMEQQIRPKLPPSFTDEPVLQESFEQGIQAIQQELPGIQQRVAALLIRRCVDALVNVKTFTSRYGEGPPKEPSQFVTQILEPLSQYIVGPGATLKSAVRDECAME